MQMTSVGCAPVQDSRSKVVLLVDISTVANELPENGFIAKGGAKVERSPATDIFYVDTIPTGVSDTGATRYCGFRTPEQTSTATGTQA